SAVFVPLFVRISATDHADGGFAPDDAATVSEWAREHGADLIDVSSGGLVASQRIDVFPGYQVALAGTVRRGSRIPTSAVGLITAAEQAERVLEDGEADAIFAGREWLRDPHFGLRAAHELGVDVPWPVQYERARWR
ncbi:MAG TPA: oxidoreductase, partial [Microbacterium sp.]|nr:oxidoreductase [Microbacterium sp.]